MIFNLKINSFTNYKFFITLSANEHVKPVPSGSTKSFLTTLSSTIIEKRCDLRPPRTAKSFVKPRAYKIIKLLYLDL
jgi:hypothetical protein